MKKLLIAGAVFCLAAPATAEPAKITIELSDEQADAIIQAGAACLEKQPYACADYAIYIRNMVNAARLPKEKK